MPGKWTIFSFNRNRLRRASKLSINDVLSISIWSHSLDYKFVCTMVTINRGDIFIVRFFFSCVCEKNKMLHLLCSKSKKIENIQRFSSVFVGMSHMPQKLYYIECDSYPKCRIARFKIVLLWYDSRSNNWQFFLCICTHLLGSQLTHILIRNDSIISFALFIKTSSAKAKTTREMRRSKKRVHPITIKLIQIANENHPHLSKSIWIFHYSGIVLLLHIHRWQRRKISALHHYSMVGRW